MTPEQLAPTFAARITGLDTTQPLTQDQITKIESAMDQYAVLTFPNQSLTDDQQLAFTLNFGALETTAGGNLRQPNQARISTQIADVSNLDENNRPLARDDRRRMFNLGNQLWHSDSSFRATPAKYSILSGRAVATTGGNTEFADMRAAYDALDARTKAEIEPLICEHSLLYSRGTLGFDDITPEERAMFTPVRQRLVRTHPVTGRKSLYLSSHIGNILEHHPTNRGHLSDKDARFTEKARSSSDPLRSEELLAWPTPEARAFIRDLTEHATQKQFTYIHQWRQHDLVMWDNRQTMHRVRRFDAHEIRDMRRTTVAGDAPTYVESQAA